MISNALASSSNPAEYSNLGDKELPYIQNLNHKKMTFSQLSSSIFVPFTDHMLYRKNL
jgi:hypothetical protein